MKPTARNVPDASDILCEHCGYTLNGLPITGRCPECGQLIDDSLGHHRHLPAWESIGIPRLAAFADTSREVIFHPRRFYQTLAIHGDLPAARKFARWHLAMASVGFGLAASGHFMWDIDPGWLRDFSGDSLGGARLIEFAATAAILTVLTVVALSLLTRLAARLTNIESKFWGMRLPRDVVLRGLYYHAAHYLPVALAATMLVLGYRLLRAVGVFNGADDLHYLYCLCALVILSAGYLFRTYWVAMRNMMFANK